MFDLYQYLLRFGVARLAKWKPDFLHPDVFARAVKQIRRIPWGGRAASPTDRLTVPATNHTHPPLPPSLPHCLASPALLAAWPTFLVPEPSYQAWIYSCRHDRSTTIIRRVNERGYSMQDQPVYCSHANTSATEFSSLSHPREYIDRSSAVNLRLLDRSSKVYSLVRIRVTTNEQWLNGEAG